MKKSAYTITLYEFNTKKEVQCIAELKTIPITKDRCLEICQDEIKKLNGNACFLVKPRRYKKSPAASDKGPK